MILVGFTETSYVGMEGSMIQVEFFTRVETRNNSLMMDQSVMIHYWTISGTAEAGETSLCSIQLVYCREFARLIFKVASHPNIFQILFAE